MFSDVLLTVDYDRTLTAPDSTIPERNLEAVRYFIQNGGTFTVNTGRSLPMTAAFREIIPVNAPLLLYNGGMAYDLQKEEITFCTAIDLDLWSTIRETTAMFPDLTVEMQGLDAHYCFSPNPGWEGFSENNRCAHRMALPGEALGPFLKFSLYGAFREMTVAEMFEGSREEIARMDAAEALLREKYGAVCEVFRPAQRIIDIHPKGVSKGIAARQLQKQLHKKWLICAGDALNDLAMMQAADHAFCPADGILAEQFENVCPCGQGAVADVILKKIPQILGIKP